MGHTVSKVSKAIERGLGEIHVAFLHNHHNPKDALTANLFLILEHGNSKGTKGAIGNLGNVQQASLHIMGAIKSAPMDVIDACADLLPFPLLISKVIHHATTSLVMLPLSHPLTKHVIQVHQEAQSPNAQNHACLQHLTR